MLTYRVRRCGEVQSTNDEVRRDPAEGLVVTARSQRAGRGQKGNGWESEPGQNLIFSLYLTPRFLPCRQQFYLSRAVSLALADTFAHFAIDVRIKWPNDIYAGDRKIVGVLIENSIGMNGCMLDSVVGIGLNVNQTVFTSDAPNPVSMRMLTGQVYDTDAVLRVFLDAFALRYEQLAAGAFGALGTQYMARLYRAGVWHAFRDADGLFRGRIEDVAPEGDLVVRREDGRTSRYLFKQVEYIL